MRVVAVSAAGLQSAPSEVTLIPDSSPPLALASPTVHTGAASARRQASDCCLRVSWLPWAEQETDVTGYQICHRVADGDTRACLDVGNATRVLIVLPASKCTCAAPTSSSESSFGLFEHTVANATGMNSITFTIHASNALGLTSATPPIVVQIERQPPAVVAPIRFVGASQMVGTNATGVCSAAEVVQSDISVLHPARRPLELSWLAAEPEDAR